MTIRELYEWAKQNQLADAEIKIQYRDNGRCYDLFEENIEIQDDSCGKNVIL